MVVDGAEVASDFLYSNKIIAVIITTGNYGRVYLLYGGSREIRHSLLHLFFESAIEIRGLRFKLGTTSIYHFIHSFDA